MCSTYGALLHVNIGQQGRRRKIRTIFTLPPVHATALQTHTHIHIQCSMNGKSCWLLLKMKLSFRIYRSVWAFNIVQTNWDARQIYTTRVCVCRLDLATRSEVGNRSTYYLCTDQKRFAEWKLVRMPFGGHGISFCRGPIRRPSFFYKWKQKPKYSSVLALICLIWSHSTYIICITSTVTWWLRSVGRTDLWKVKAVANPSIIYVIYLYMFAGIH